MSTNLLHIDSSILGGNSVSRALSASIVARLTAANPDVRVTYRDLAGTPIAHLSGRYLGAMQATDGSAEPTVQADLETGRAVMDEFLAADTVVVGVGFYNFGIPSQLKAWIDRLAVAGKTFRYTESGPVGLAGGKRVILAIARGGLYGPGSPREALEHAESYLRGIFGFMGISDVAVVVAEGLAISPAMREAAIARAYGAIAAIPTEANALAA